MKKCPKCGSVLSPHPSGLESECPTCGWWEGEYVKFVGSRGWYSVWVVSPDAYPLLLSWFLRPGKFKELASSVPSPPLFLLPLLGKGVWLGGTDCHRADIRASGLWQGPGLWQWGRAYWFALPAKVWDGSRRHEWTWVLRPPDRFFFFCRDCQRRDCQRRSRHRSPIRAPAGRAGRGEKVLSALEQVITDSATL